MAVDFLAHSLTFVTLGWRVFPVSPGSKLPAVPKTEGGRGVLDATNDTKQIEKWAARWPNANIGVACGPESGIIVLDIDTGHGGLEAIRALQKQGKHFPSTVMARTANGGWHAYFRWVAGPNNSKSRLGKGIDIRTGGGYVVAPPSVLDGGKAYSWQRRPLGPMLPDFPAWAVQALKPREETPFFHERVGDPGDMKPLLDKLLELGNGERNSILYWCALRGAEMVKRGEISPSDVANQLRFASMSKGITAKEADKTIGSAFNKIFGGRA